MSKAFSIDYNVDLTNNRFIEDNKIDVIEDQTDSAWVHQKQIKVMDRLQKSQACQDIEKKHPKPSQRRNSIGKVQFNNAIQINLKEQLNKYYAERLEIVYKTNLIVILINLGSLSNLEFAMIQLIYHSLTGISILLTILYRYKANSVNIKSALAISILRNTLRLFDFEETQQHLFFIIAFYFVLTLICSKIFFFAGEKKPVVQVVLLLLLQMFGVNYVSRNIEDMHFKLFSSIIFFLAILTHFQSCQTQIDERFQLIGQIYQKTETMNSVITKFESPVLIINQKKEIEFANERFQKQFEKKMNFEMYFKGSFANHFFKSMNLSIFEILDLLKELVYPEEKIQQQDLYQKEVLKFLDQKILGQFIDNSEKRRNQSIADVYKTGHSQANFESLYSLMDLIELDTTELYHMIFYVSREDSDPSNNTIQYTTEGHAHYMARAFFKVSINKLILDGQEMSIFQFQDKSSNILYDKINMQKQILEKVSQSVQIEMKNPLNSILALNIEKYEFFKQLKNNKELYEAMQQDSDPEVLYQMSTDFCKIQLEIVDKLVQGTALQDSSAQTLAQKLSSWLDYGQIKAQKFRKNLSYFNVVQTLENIVTNSQFKAQENNNEVFLKFMNIKTSTSNGKNDPLVYTDCQRLRQVITSLLENALVYTKNGKINIKVKIISQMGHKFLAVSIEDTGVGIPDKKIKYIYQLFQSNDWKSQEFKLKRGIGLGLIISDHIVKMFGGTINVESTKGKGSLFLFTFRLDEQIESDSEDSVSSNYSDQESVQEDHFTPEFKLLKINNYNLVFQNYDDQQYVRNLDGQDPVTFNQSYDRKILIIDDQSSNIAAMKILLKYRVGLDTDKYCISAMSGEQAIELITKDFVAQQESGQLINRFELILMDLDMPIMSGYELTKKIREIMNMFGVPQSVISAVTGVTNQKHIKKASESGMNQIISKPVDVDVLTHLIHKIDFPVKQNK